MKIARATTGDGRKLYIETYCFFNDTAATGMYTGLTHPSLHVALSIYYTSK